MPTLHHTPAAARTLRCLEHGRRADPARLRRVRRALDKLAVDPRHPGVRDGVQRPHPNGADEGRSGHPGLCSHRYPGLPGHPHHRAWTSYVDQGAGARRLFWTGGSAGDGQEQDHVGRDGAVLTVLLIGPHL